MKNSVYLILCIGVLASCTPKKAQKNDETAVIESNQLKPEKNMEQQTPHLVGIKKRADLKTAPYNTWFAANYDTYDIDESAVKKIKPLLKDVTIKVFMGTWCGDSKHQTPPFYKILDAAKYDEEKLTLITVSRAKTTPEKYEEGLDIIKVPTFIFYKNGKEINRIVEYPVASLEKDMLAILSGKKYKHAYAE